VKIVSPVAAGEPETGCGIAGGPSCGASSTQNSVAARMGGWIEGNGPWLPETRSADWPTYPPSGQHAHHAILRCADKRAHLEPPPQRCDDDERPATDPAEDWLGALQTPDAAAAPLRTIIHELGADVHPSIPPSLHSSSSIHPSMHPPRSIDRGHRTSQPAGCNRQPTSTPTCHWSVCTSLPPSRRYGTYDTNTDGLRRQQGCADVSAKGAVRHPTKRKEKKEKKRYGEGLMILRAACARTNATHVCCLADICPAEGKNNNNEWSPPSVRPAVRRSGTRSTEGRGEACR